jgi:chromosome segregation ATPase
MSQLELWSENEEVQLQYHEQVIEKGLETFYEVGQSLAFIRENRLYRKEFKTFEEYCQEKWGRSRRWANQIIKSSEVIGVLESGNHGSQIPETERQARPLTKLETPEQQSEAWGNAVTNTKQEDGKPTAKEVDAEVKKLREKLRQKEGEVTQLKQANQFVTSELQKQKELVTGIEATLQDSAKSLAKKMAETEVKKATVELRNEVTQLKAEKQRLENNQALAESNMTKAKEDYEKALDKFKNNPDPDTKKKLDELQTQYRQMQVDVQQATFKLQNLKEKEDQAFSASFELERFFGNFNKLIANHPDAITAMGSRYLTDSSLSKLDSLANTLEYWAETIRKSIALARSDNATAIRSVDVEVLEPEDDEF